MKSFFVSDLVKKDKDHLLTENDLNVVVGKDQTTSLLPVYNQKKTKEKYDILKVQKKGNNRYLPFVCNVDNIK